MYIPSAHKAGIAAGAVGFGIKSLAVVVVAFAFIGIGSIIIRKMKSKNDAWK